MMDANRPKRWPLQSMTTTFSNMATANGRATSERVVRAHFQHQTNGREGGTADTACFSAAMGPVREPPAPEPLSSAMTGTLDPVRAARALLHRPRTRQGRRLARAQHSPWSPRATRLCLVPRMRGACHMDPGRTSYITCSSRQRGIYDCRHELYLRNSYLFQRTGVLVCEPA